MKGQFAPVFLARILVVLPFHSYITSVWVMNYRVDFLTGHYKEFDI